MISGYMRQITLHPSWVFILILLVSIISGLSLSHIEINDTNVNSTPHVQKERPSLTANTPLHLQLFGFIPPSILKTDVLSSLQASVSVILLNPFEFLLLLIICTLAATRIKRKIQSKPSVASNRLSLSEQFTVLLSAYACYVSSRPKPILMLVIFLTLFMGHGLSKLEMRIDQKSDLPADDPIVSTINKIKEVFEEKGVITIGIKANNIYTTSTLKKISKIAEDLKSINSIIPDEIYGLSTVNNIKGQDWGLNVGRFMKSIPGDGNAIQTLKDDIKNNDLVFGKMVSKNGQFTAIRANLRDDYDQAEVHRQVYEIVERYQGPEEIIASGDPIFMHEITLGLQKDTALIIPLALLVIMLGLYLFFSTPRGVFLPLLIIMLTIFWAKGLMGLTGLPDSVVTSALPALMVVVTGSYCIHFLIYYYELIEKNNPVTAIRLATERVLPALITVGLSSALGAATLCVFRVVSIREFAIIVVMGVLAALFLTITVMPACLALMQKPKKNPLKNSHGYIEKILLKLTDFSIHKNKTVLASFAGLIIVSIVGIFQIRTGNDVVSIFPPEHRGRLSIEMFNQELGGARYMNVMIEAPQKGDIQSPEYLKTILQFQSYMESLPGVGYSESFANIIRHISNEINHQTSHDFKPSSQAEIAQYLLLYEMSGEPGDFSDVVDYDYQRAKIRIILSTSDPDVHKHLYKQAKDYLEFHLPDNARAEFGGEIMFWIAQVDYVVIGKILNIITAIIVISIFVSLIFRSLLAGLLSVVPVIMGTFATFGVMGFLNIRLDFPTSIITAIAVGIGVDFSIHYLSRLIKESQQHFNLETSLNQTAKISGRAIIYDSASNILGFVVVIFSGFLPVQNFGILISITMLLMAISTLLLLPALISFIQPNFLNPTSKAKTITLQRKLTTKKIIV